MSDVSETELFSAYLDGELTAEEQVRAEQILATSPEARQLLEELRALGSTLQGLPQQKVGEDLSARVLAIAERRMLSPEEPSVSGTLRVPDTKPAAGRSAAAMKAPSESEGFPWREVSWRGMFSPRALIWSAIVIAVALIIHIKSPVQQDRKVAKVDDQQPVRQATSEGSMESADKPGGAPMAKKPAAPAELARDENPATATASAAAPGMADDDKLAVGHGRGESKPGEFMAAKEKKAEPAPPAALAAPMAREKSEGHSMARAPSIAPKAPAGAEHEAKEKQVPLKLSDSGGMLAKAPSALKGVDSLNAAKDASKALAEGAQGASQEAVQEEQKREVPPLGAVAKSEAAPNGPMADKSGAAAPAGVPAAALPAAPPQAAPPAETAKGDERADEAAMVVRLNISEEAARTRVFGDLLAKNGLVARVTPEDRRAPYAYYNNSAQQNDGSLAAGQASENRPALSANGYSAGNANQQRQVASQPTPEIAQNSASRAEVTGQRRGAPSASAARNAAAPQSAPPETLQSKTAERDRSQTSATWNLGQAGEPGVLYYEIEASPQQLDALLKGIGERRDAFSPPVIASSATATENRYRRAMARKSGDGEAKSDNRAEFGAAQNEAPDHAIKNASNAPAEPSQLDSDQTQHEALRDERAKPQAVGGAGGKLQYQPPASASSAPTAKTRIRFVLNVVDRVAPPPAAAAAPAAAPAPAKGK